MTDLEKEMLRQIHELDKEVKVLRERVAKLEVRPWPTAPYTPQPVFPAPLPEPYPWRPPFEVTCTDSTKDKSGELPR